MVRRTKEEAQETRNRLLDTAERVFNERGVSRTSLAEIAQAAGVTRGAIYWHFKNKLDLFNAMMERVALPMEEVSARFGEEYPADPLAAIRDRAVALLKALAADAQMQRVFDIMSHKCEYVDDMAPLRDRHLECRGECVAQMQEAFRHAVATGRLPKTVNPRHAAIGLHAMIDGIIVNWLLDPRYLDLHRDAGKVVDGYLRGLGVVPVPPALSGRGAATASSFRKPGPTTKVKH
ncbi:MAG: TetR family transcriptional regulator [Betaproteobacteria bacterium]|nr:TetR family transcriptional regulator [Betaproteobacteria bacterium]